jgi:hypothetical protein
MNVYDNYFTRYGTSMEMIVSGRLKVEQQPVREQLQVMVGHFESTPHSIPTDHFWLRDFLLYARVLNINITGQQFYTALTQRFFDDFAQYRFDVILERDTTGGERAARTPINTTDIFVRHMRLYIPLTYMQFDNRSSAMHTMLAVQQRVQAIYPDWVRVHARAPVDTSCADDTHLRRVVSSRRAIRRDYSNGAVESGRCRTCDAHHGRHVYTTFRYAHCALCECMCPGHGCSVAFMIVSINFGVLGALSLWHVNLDIISLITILLSIGVHARLLTQSVTIEIQVSPSTSSVTSHIIFITRTR